MDIMEDVLPINLDDWEVVQRTHALTYPFSRSVMTLQRVFNDLARVTEPTGDPNIPPAVKKAKVLRHKLREKTEGTTGSPEAEDMVLGIDNEEDDEDEEAEDDAGEDKNEDEEYKEEDGDDLVEYPPSVIRTGTVNQRPSPTGGVSISSTSKPGKSNSSSKSKTAKKSRAALDRTSGAYAAPYASPKFTAQLMSMKTPTPTTGMSKKSHSEDSGFSFQNMMGMMMMQQQQERESIREDRFFQAEQMKMEREERAEQARQDRAQQQQMMTMMMMAMMGGGKRARGRGYSDDDDDDDNSGKKKWSPRKMSPRKEG